MNRFLSLILSCLLLASCTACAGLAAAAGDPGGASAQRPSRGDKPVLSAGPAAPQTQTGQEMQTAPETPPVSQEPASPAPPQEEAPSPAAPEEPEAEEPAPEPAPPAKEEADAPRTVDPAKPMVALTFDDGPNASYSDKILDILEENHAVATFFEVGRNVANCPQPLSRMVELGCEIGSHSYVHKDLSKLSAEALMADLAAADQAFIDAVGFAPTLLRPPYGAVNRAVKHDTGRSVITWTVDTEDWRSQDTEKIVSYVKSLASLDGEIVLLHSSYETTVEAVRILIPWLIQQGYQLVTVSELMAYYYGELPQSGQFYGYTYFTTHGKTDTPLSLPASEAPAEDPEALPPDSGEAPPAQPEDPLPEEPAESSTEETPAEPPAEETPAGEAAPPEGEDSAEPGRPVPEKPKIPGTPPAKGAPAAL